MPNNLWKSFTSPPMQDAKWIHELFKMHPAQERFMNEPDRRFVGYDWGYKEGDATYIYYDEMDAGKIRYHPVIEMKLVNNVWEKT